ncbi:phosphonate ABC transporter substrate-binding protein [Oscillatoria sp. CS-180]|uniref:phosphonate ABC transporter substrate-binding protein n=1 Tax=Oscillatoria sp. CS-180 TaxID=3021720 RepID=UPI00232BCEB1|nr:phosphonate ABC transporter substrate-binding protein [Oscillatoria sp. CS-180]MDB9529039.1 phosphonate ABC transporter substrate-binding protein [Oscillatoria sp. CS-180]
MTSVLKRWSARLACTVVGTAMIASCSGAPTPEATEPAAADAADATAEGGVCAPDIAEIDFGIISTESQENLQELWEPFLARMSEEMGRPVNGFYATDYAGVIEAMGAGKIQIAWYGGKSYIEAAKRSGAEAFAQTVASDGSKGYYAHLITNQGNPIVGEIDVETGNGDQYVIDNASDLTFAFNDPNSTSGFLVPSYYVFAQNGVNPEEAFSELVFSGSHEATAQAVANNQVDVATNNSESMARLQETDAEAYEQVQIIWTSPLIPSDPIAYKSDIPDCLKTEFQDFFHNFEDETVLGPLDWAGFDPAGDTDWNTIRELDIAKQMEEVKNDDVLNDADKSAKLEELEQQLAELK